MLAILIFKNLNNNKKKELEIVIVLISVTTFAVVGTCLNDCAGSLRMDLLLLCILALKQ
jgi:membrane protein YqaA with SNARE-associated domain